MKRYHSIPILAMAFFGIAGCSPCETCVKPSVPTVRLDKVNFAEFVKAVEAQKGKVVVVDVWGEFCPPCKKKFPHVVKIHEEFAKLGVVVMSLSLDDADNETAVNEFLTKEKAHFANYRLEDTDDNKVKANDIIEIGVPPLLHVFDRTGKLVKTFDNKNSHEQVDSFIKELAEAK